MTRQAENKRNAMAFYDLMFNQCQAGRGDRAVCRRAYTQHNPGVGDGKAAFIAYFERMAQEYPGKRVQFKRAIAEDEYVVLHCYQTVAGRPRLRRDRHLPLRRERQDRRALGRAPGHPRDLRQPQHHVLSCFADKLTIVDPGAVPNVGYAGLPWPRIIGRRAYSARPVIQTLGNANVHTPSEREPAQERDDPDTGADRRAHVRVAGAAYAGEIRGCQESPYAWIQQEMIEIRGLPLLHEVKERYIARDEFRTELANMEIADDVRAQTEGAERTMIALGLIPEGTDLFGVTLEEQANQIVGYYDPDTKEMVMISDSGGSDALAQITYAHEFVHALQDQHFDLNSLQDQVDALDDSEATSAFRALVEGDATVAQFQFMLRHPEPGRRHGLWGFRRIVGATGHHRVDAVPVPGRVRVRDQVAAGGNLGGGQHRLRSPAGQH